VEVDLTLTPDNGNVNSSTLMEGFTPLLPNLYSQDHTSPCCARPTELNPEPRLVLPDFRPPATPPKGRECNQHGEATGLV